MATTRTSYREPAMAFAFSSVAAIGSFTAALAGESEDYPVSHTNWLMKTAYFSEGQTKRPAPIEGIRVFGGEQTAPTFVTPPSSKAHTLSAQKEELLTTLRDLKLGAEGRGIRVATLDDAMAVALVWPVELPLPCLEVDEDGIVSFEVMTDEGLALAGMEFMGDNHSVAYSIVEDITPIAHGYADTTSQTEILTFFQKLSKICV